MQPRRLSDISPSFPTLADLKHFHEMRGACGTAHWKPAGPIPRNAGPISFSKNRAPPGSRNRLFLPRLRQNPADLRDLALLQQTVVLAEDRDRSLQLLDRLRGVGLILAKLLRLLGSLYLGRLQFLLLRSKVWDNDV